MKLFTAVFGTSTVAAISAYAGGVANMIVETAPVVMEPTETVGSSAPSWVIPVIIIAALVGAAALSGDDDDDDNGGLY
ncbi:hypothetical protein DS901_18025 [Loktanella sp. D2R18]|uniref:hypothetical protein n=1 Tax=Rhodobacterales TaxID=204455 RepID=UPI000DE8BC06|nr:MULTISPECIES: hypothetical protein [Rhodobacterales]MDO6590495.1 hypothetical protein [Yoonia sp. 1_MG-2023]RBW41213.1 hypothetical protein DS901_18025 [Loktanella sp. D2R18]